MNTTISVVVNEQDGSERAVCGKCGDTRECKSDKERDVVGNYCKGCKANITQIEVL